jgi:hypothetical protein
MDMMSNEEPPALRSAMGFLKSILRTLALEAMTIMGSIAMTATINKRVLFIIFKD